MSRLTANNWLVPARQGHVAIKTLSKYKTFNGLRRKKGKSSGPSEVSYEMFSNEVCIRELCGVVNALLMGEICQSCGRGAQLFPCIKVREMCYCIIKFWGMG